MSLFNTIVAYRIDENWAAPGVAVIDDKMSTGMFQPCGATQEISKGWAPARGKDFGAYLESVGGQLIAKFTTEKKTVPASAIKAELDERCKVLAEQRGTKVGSKEKRELKDEIKLTLLPRAFSKKSSNMLWLDLENRTLVVGAGSHKAAENCVNALVELFSDLGTPILLAPLNTKMSPQGAMSVWLAEQEAPANFDLGTEVELKQASDKACVKYAKHTLQLAEIATYIAQGKLPTKLSLLWDGKVAFTLSDSFVLSKIALVDVSDSLDKAEDPFDTDVALMTAELSSLLPDLLVALGGEVTEEA